MPAAVLAARRLLLASSRPPARAILLPRRPMAAAAGGAAPPPPPPSDADPYVQYVVLRRDLWDGGGWPLGAVVAQGCHAATAALWAARGGGDAAAYCAPDAIDHMRKVCERGREWKRDERVVMTPSH
jgi:hypothetical protein